MTSNPLDGWFRLSPEVEEALARGKAVVALESTVIAQGLPWPRNLETAVALESAMRRGGAVPATIAVIDGVACVGLEPAEIERIARADHVEKLSTRDLPLAIAGRSTGATTVAATAHLARRAGISVFATGGIGGVHRGDSLDVSADLTQLQRTPIIVVCAGAKSILDLARTRELLETLGILVLGWRTASLPAFYVRESRLEVDARVESAREVAGIWQAAVEVGGEAAILLCVPIPEAAALPSEEFETLLSSALERASAGRVRGKGITPYLLGDLARNTMGTAVEANVALLLNNAEVAAALAVEIATR